MKNLCFFILIFCNLIYADIIYLKDGSTMEGEILEKTEEYIKIKMPVGTPSRNGSGGGCLVEVIPMGKIQTFKTTAQIIEEERRYEREQIAKGLIKINNEWVTQEKLKELGEKEKKQEEEYMKNLGLIQYDGRWVTLEEKEIIEKEKIREEEKKQQFEELMQDAVKLNSGLIKIADNKWLTVEEIFKNILTEAEVKAKQIKDKNTFFLNKTVATLNIIDNAIQTCQYVIDKHEDWRAGMITTENLDPLRVDKNLILEKTGFGNLIKNYSTLIERLLKECSNYPQKYREIYDCTLEIYLNYKIYQNYILSPNVILGENQQKINEILEKIIRYYEKVNILLPDSGHMVNIPSIKSTSQGKSIKSTIEELETKTNLIKIQTAEINISGNITVALDLYALDNNRYPSTEQGLAALIVKPYSNPIPKNWIGPYLKEIPVDPWGNAYQYISPGIHNSNYDLYSCGPDGIDGTADDITNWK